jgi:hypothetical protein
MILQNEGVRKDESGHYVFDYDFDFDEDIIYLAKDTSGIKETENLTYYYGFEFNPNTTEKQQRDFRDALKHKMGNSRVFYGDDATRFVEDGIYALDEMKNFDDFSVVISTASEYGEKTLSGLMRMIIWDMCAANTNVYNMQLIKKFCKDVTFDEDRARAALLKTKRYGKRPNLIDGIIKSMKEQFEEAKQENGLFKIKRYKPVAGRYGFIDFLRFRNPQDQETYERLQEGTEVLICDDFITSGSTVNEIIRFLNTINPNNKISVFVLINQKRDY